MWKLLYQSVRGTSHERSGKDCQDNCLATTLQLPSETFVLLACADGAGSALYSELASKCACEMAITEAARWLEEKQSLSGLTSTDVKQWIEQIRSRLGDLAAERDVAVRELATTLLFAIVGEGQACFFQIGDGVIVVETDGAYRHVFWPQNGDYANTTYFITDPTAIERLQFAQEQNQIDEVALLTDGLQMLALTYSEQRVHGPFFAPMFQTLGGSEAAEELFAPLAGFLGSAAVNDRTDDDKTLVLAKRCGKGNETI
ncbi:MAG: protein phosphatase 2C domain-containing protein [Pirellula sp.]|nr:protein phosphatase 2C domain-containing protein [Pirellula sp.]